MAASEPAPAKPAGLLAGLARDSLLNLAGYALPIAAALVAVPRLLAGLGPERFAVLALAWALVSVFGVLDLGLGRALTHLVAQRTAAGRETELPALVSSSLGLLLGLGLGSALVLGLAAPWVSHFWWGQEGALAAETTAALRVLAAAVPLAVLGSGLRGVLEARRRFALVNVVRVPTGVLAALGPLAVLGITPVLPWVMLVLVLVRAGAFVAYLLPCLSLVSPGAMRAEAAREVLRHGGSMMVSNLVAPLLQQLDRFVLAAVQPLAAVAAYATPYEVVSRVSVLPAALMAVLFPTWSALLARDRPAAEQLYRQSRRWLALLLAPPLALGALAARPALAWWIGPEAAEPSVVVARLLLAGAFCHALAQPPFHLLQAAGRADLTARLHLLEVPLYLAYLLPLALRFGAEGTAAAWAMRTGLSALALAWLARRHGLRGRATGEEQP